MKIPFIKLVILFIPAMLLDAVDEQKNTSLQTEASGVVPNAQEAECINFEMWQYKVRKQANRAIKKVIESVHELTYLDDTANLITNYLVDVNPKYDAEFFEEIIKEQTADENKTLSLINFDDCFIYMDDKLLEYYDSDLPSKPVRYNFNNCILCFENAMIF